MTRAAVLRALAFVSFVVSIVLSSGCGEEPPRIVLWHAYRGDEESAITELAKTYEKEHGIAIELLSIPFDAYASKLEAAIPHAHGLDAFIDAHERLGTHLQNKLVAPIGDALPDADVASYEPVSVAAVTVDGTRYAVPLAEKCIALYVNENLVPKPPGTPRTIEEIVALRKTLAPGTYPLVYEAGSPYFHAPFLPAFGASMLGPNESFGMVGPGAEQSVALVRDWTKAGALPEEPGGALVKQLFSQGRAATAISGPWLASDLGNDVAYRIEPLPFVGATGKKMRPLLTVDGAFLTPTGATRADVRAFVKWLGGDESSRVRATIGKQVVANAHAWDDPKLASDKILSAFHAAAKDSDPMPTSTAMRATWVPAQEAIRKVLRGDAEPKVALEEARARFIDALKPPPPPPSPLPLVVSSLLVVAVLAFFAVKRTREPGFAAELRRGKPAYAYVTHAAVIVFLLVVLPLVLGALTSFFAGTRDKPQYVGLGNYIAILTARGGDLLGHGSFYLTLIVTVTWTIVNIALHVGIGMALGLLLSRSWLRLRALYRVLLIIPWAVPNYVTALAWKGMFHRQFGAINAILTALGAEPVSFFSHFSTAFAANVATNVWLGFPFMMVITLGALTSIPKEVLEAAEVDGATRWQRFRHVTFPLLMPNMLPAIVLGAVWTFNMFNVVFLVSGGEPDGTTDILVSEAYRWAFTRNSQYGYAAAYAVLILFLLLGMTRALGRISKQEKEAR
jgi:arabinogalactan oligomer/maltooligosaccharide transport system permease protein